ncbi:hypothetical protein T484DRAFT_3133603 [Baffinella frigidus]|nr:hypothetical protein T484DRAFT_3133603 [Cryptophyta sp. CCMP2293]
MPSKSTTPRARDLQSPPRQASPRHRTAPDHFSKHPSPRHHGRFGRGTPRVNTPKDLVEKKRALLIQKDLDAITAKYASVDLKTQPISSDGGLMSHLSTALAASADAQFSSSAGQKPLVQRRLLLDATFREMDDLSKVLKELAAQRSQFEKDASGPATTRLRPGSRENATAASILGSGSGSQTDRPSHRDRPVWPHQPGSELEASAIWAQTARTRLDGVWHETRDPATNRRYFYNATTGQTSWTNPGGPSPPSPFPALTPLPAPRLDRHCAFITNT